MYNFIECNRNQMYLMPPSLKEWLPESHLAWFVMDAVEQMDLSIFYEKYRADGWGHCAYEPAMMLSLLLYAYSMGEQSSRQIERLCETDIAFRVITTNQKPDHTTLSRFRQENEKKLEELFVSVLKLCAEAGLVKVGVVALDGTKVKANAALSANRTDEHIKKEVKKILSEASAKDKEEDQRYGKDKRGDELPDELKDRRDRLVRLKECQERLERESKEKADEQQAKIDRREVEEAISGCKKRGRKPLAPDELVNKEKKANVTDPASRIMKTAKGYVQGYNGQAVVTEEQIIVAADVTQEENDVKQLEPMLKKAQANINKVGVEEEMGTGLMDAGYWSENNVKGREEVDEILIATKKDWKQRQAIREQPTPRGRIPSGLSLAGRMERKLLTKRGRTLYRKRSAMIEGVFGQIKEVRGCNRFMRRGIEATRSEWNLICATHNLLKLWRSGQVCWN
jgi:transposase